MIFHGKSIKTGTKYGFATHLVLKKTVIMTFLQLDPPTV
mgnify:CR=1 FL=1